MIPSNASYDVVLLSHKRQENLPEVLAGIKAQSPAPSRIHVWHNAPSSVPVVGAVNVIADINFRCRARHALGLLCDSEIIVFIDDDVVLTSPDVLPVLAAAADLNDGSVVGPEGRCCLSVGPEMYWGADSLRAAHHDGPASVIKGKLCAVRRPLLHHAFTHNLPDKISTEDDIVLCAEVSMATGKPARVVGGLYGKYRNLSDKKGNEARHDHFSRRNLACLHMAELGWNPLPWKR